MNPTSKIQDYAIIGDGRSAALVSREGSIAWLCWPRFDSPSLFGSILDHTAGGHWSIAPVAPARIERRYIGDTNVLQTRFHTVTDIVSVIDFMPAMSEEDKGQMLLPEHELLRRVECERGSCEVLVHFAPRPDYGREKFKLRNMGKLGVRIERAPRLITLRGDANFMPAAEGSFSARLVLSAGQRADFSLTYASEGPAVLSPLGDFVSRKLDLTLSWWRQWAARAQYTGPFREQVIRSALVLKLLSYAPSGAIVAAPTTSLPERLGGDRNWDYRFCWLRDAAFTARALFGLGYQDEGRAFVSWLLHATRLTRPELRVLYDMYGRRPPKESDLSHFQGYADSRPVRIGNAARDQLQLDAYGEVIEAVSQLLQHGNELDSETQKMLRQLGQFVCRHWREPDNGIWEHRGRRQHYTHSRLMCWVALDRLLEMERRGELSGIPADNFEKHRDEIRRDIEKRAWNQQLNCYVQVLDGETLDATALLMAIRGFDDPASWQMQRTFEVVGQRLGAGGGLIYCNEESRQTGEGAFAMCGFWMAEFLAKRRWHA